MQPLYLKKKTQSEVSSFQINHAKVPYMYDKWHFHQELELNWIIHGTGTRFVGDSIQKFNHNDMVLIGQNLPHVWKNESQYYQGDPNIYADVINIHFLPDILGDAFLGLPELQHVKELFQRAEKGIRYHGITCKRVGKLLLKIAENRGTKNQILILLEILELLSRSHEYQELSSSGFMNHYHPSHNSRINKIYAYVMNNFQSKMILAEVAELAHMNTSAFSRYFKKATKKNFVQFLNEIRVGYACKLLIDDDLSIAQIGYQCGFNNLSNFNRQFKKIIGISPKAYKAEHLVL